MQHLRLFFCLILLSGFQYSQAQEVITLDWEELRKTEPWKATEQWEPVPQKVTPGVFTAPPSDAIVLFDGTNLDHWMKPKYGYGARMDEVASILAYKVANPNARTEAEWEVKEGTLIVNPGSGAIETKQGFGDVQLHIEWLSPVSPDRKDQGYSNSGIFFMGLYEIQVLNSYENPTYPNGQAGAIYKQHMPLVNATRPPGEWQAYDIVFNAPRFNEDGSLKSPARLTAFHNGVLIQNNVELLGPAIFIGKPEYIQHPEKLPLLLQDHGDRVRFRNIWIREL